LRKSVGAFPISTYIINTLVGRKRAVAIGLDGLRGFVRGFYERSSNE